MNTLVALAYGAAMGLARTVAAAAPSGDAKWLRSLRGRRGVVERFRAWGERGRDPSRPLLWIHAPSVGEGLMARPLLELVRAHEPSVQLAYTFYSPSAEAFADGLSVDFRDYLPFDTARDSRAVVAALRPTVLVYAKLDVWPNLTHAAKAVGARVALVSASLSPGSSRNGPMARALLTSAYAALDVVGAASERDADRLVSLGVPREHVRVTGDTRYDQVLARVAAVDRASPLLAPLASDRPTLVAGSTWPSDESVLLPAWGMIRQQVPDARLIIAPHEPTLEHLGPIERWAREAGLRVARLSAADVATADVVLVDRVGVLADLYALGSVAFVGGGFRGAGLHSVVEPAAFGLPVVFGPRHGNSRDAGALLARGAGATEANAHDVAEAIIDWLRDLTGRSTAGAKAREVVDAGAGAAERTFGLVRELLAVPVIRR